MTTSKKFFRVQRKMCKTCIYGKNSGVRRSIQQLEAQVADPHMPGMFLGYRTCHHSKDVCCAGFWRRHRHKFPLGQIAQRLGFVRYVTVDLFRKVGE